MLFAEAIDTNKPLAEFSAEMILDFADLLRFLPARRADKYRDVPVLEFRSRAVDLAVPTTSLMAYKTKINVLTMLRAFVNWLPKRGHTSFDHAKLLSLTISELTKALRKEYDKQGGSSRISFSDAELQLLFAPEQYVSETDKYPERFWLPILALYTGGRTQDLLTLRRRDIKVTPDNPDIFHVKGGSLDEDTSRDGIPYIDLTDTMEKELKTARANRVIPIHPFVWDGLGFSRFIETFAPDEFLFGNHVMDNGELSNSFGAWFTRYRRSVGVGRQAGDKASRDVVFHSFRHTVKRAFRLKQCDQSVVHEIIGHDDEKETATSMMYSGAFLIEQKLDGAIAKLDFHKRLPLMELVASKWASGAKIVVKRMNVNRHAIMTHLSQ
jgi:integrase